MMELRTLERIVAQGEGLQLEFKRKLPEPAKTMREVVALANTEGGLFLVGVEDDGQILGVKDADESEEAFKQWVQKLVRPQLEYTLNRVQISRKRSVIAVDIPKSKRKPHQVIVDGKDGNEKKIAYVRVKDKSMRASREMFYVMLKPEDKDVRFEYGDKENLLMKYLDENEYITLKQFARLARISPWRASKTLVLLVRANVLAIQPDEVADKFTLAF